MIVLIIQRPRNSAAERSGEVYEQKKQNKQTSKQKRKIEVF